MTVINTTYNEDGSVTVYYLDGTNKTYPAGSYTSNPGTGSTPTGTTGTTGTTPTTGTGKKWWEVAATSVTSIISSIFGGKQTANTGVTPYGYYPTTTTGNNGNMILIIAVVAVVILLMMKKK